MNEVLDFLKKCKTYYLATLENGKPRVRPFGTAEVFEGKLYIQTGKKKEVFKQILENPNVEICAYDGDTWMRVEGKLIIDDRIDAKKYMLDQNPYLRSMYDEQDDNTAVLYFENGIARIYSFTSDIREIRF